MPVVLGSRFEITLEVYERVAWGRESVRLEPGALERADATRTAFLRLLARPDVIVYGVTSGYGDWAAARLEPDEWRRQSRAAALQAHHSASRFPSASCAGSSWREPSMRLRAYSPPPAGDERAAVLSPASKRG